MKRQTMSASPEPEMYWANWTSPFGELSVFCSETGVRELAIGKAQVRKTQRKSTDGNTSRLSPAQDSRSKGAKLARQAISELREYAAGKRKRFTVPLDLEGTPFQQQVWKALCEIPYGETRSYKEVASTVGNPRASRAVGMANHWNPVAIMVPCHRVITSDGKLGGYASGLSTKQKLLKMEQGQS